MFIQVFPLTVIVIEAHLLSYPVYQYSCIWNIAYIIVTVLMQPVVLALTVLCYSVILHSLSIVNCSDPIAVPRNGSIDPYQNTTEGAEVFFSCNPMFVPTGRMRAVCGADGRWTPDPAGLVCMCELK